ncbi:hypothetical protein AB6P12_04305 [Streptococcus mutans]|uniref:hypothetical protein n=1 Tax=Streptococcus mutans TaxID=1309 RepID=UPI0038BC412E
MVHRILSLIWLRVRIMTANKTILYQMDFGVIYIVLIKCMFAYDPILNKAKVLLLLVCLPFVLSQVIGSPVLFMTAEEKEKGTLKELLLNGAVSLDYILSISFVLIIFSCMVLSVTPIIVNVSVIHYASYFFIGLLTSVVIILFYFYLGIKSKSQISIQVLNFTAMLLSIGLPTMLQVSYAGSLANLSFMGLETRFLLNENNFNWSQAVYSLVSVLLWFVWLLFVNIRYLKKISKTI